MKERLANLYILLIKIENEEHTCTMKNEELTGLGTGLSFRRGNEFFLSADEPATQRQRMNSLFQHDSLGLIINKKLLILFICLKDQYNYRAFCTEKKDQ